MSTPELKTYQGNCHCGRVKFHVKVPEVKAVTACNRSICFKKSYLWIFPGAGNLAFERGEDTMTSYEFRGRVFSHKFCPNCGTGIMAVGKATTGINARTLMDVDPFILEIKDYDGWNHYQPPYDPPEFMGELPNFEGEGLKIYTGSCHCGAVTLAVKTKPFPEVEVKEDSCSICQRNGYIFSYPTLPQVQIYGSQNTKSYRFPPRFSAHHFCQTCGVPLYMTIHGPPEEVLQTWPQARRDMVARKCELLPVNLRVLNGVEWGVGLGVVRTGEGAGGYFVD